MFSDEIRNYVKVERTTREELTYTSLHGSRLPLLGYVDSVAVIPARVLDRKLHEMEKVFSVMVNTLYSEDIGEVAVLFDGIEKDSMPAIIDATCYAYRILRPEVFTVWIDAIRETIMERPCEDHDNLRNLREDVIELTKMHSMGGVIPLDVMAFLTTIAYDIIHLNRKTGYVLSNIIPKDEALIMRNRYPFNGEYKLDL